MISAKVEKSQGPCSAPLADTGFLDDKVHWKGSV